LLYSAYTGSELFFVLFIRLKLSGKYWGKTQGERRKRRRLKNNSKNELRYQKPQMLVFFSLFVLTSSFLIHRRELQDQAHSHQTLSDW